MKNNGISASIGDYTSLFSDVHDTHMFYNYKEKIFCAALYLMYVYLIG